MEECEEAKEKQKERVVERESKGGKLSGGKATRFKKIGIAED